MRIASLVPSATELLFAMGLGDEVVAVTHECDYPLEAQELPQLTRSVVPSGLEPMDIDRAVRKHTGQGEALYELDEQLLIEEEPDLIVTQSLCEVCAVSYDDVRALAQRLPGQPDVISLDPTTLGEVLGDIRTIAQATDEKDAGVDLLRDLADRIDDVKIALRSVGRDDGPPRIGVLALEWLDPPFIAGHWVPQMIELAGGFDLLGLPAERSREIDWDEARTITPEVVVLMQCGYDTARSADEAERYADELKSLGARQIFASDASSYFSRPGPRLVDGLELLAHALHPDLMPEPAAGRLFEVDLV